MTKNLSSLLAFSSLLLSCLPTGNGNNLTIAVSANVQFSVEEIAEQFKETTGISCNLVIGSSGKLTAQIMEGAPYHLFLSADMKYPETLHQNGRAINRPKVYAYGNLVLYTQDSILTPSLEVLTQDKVTHIAMANPKIAPYGIAAEQVLQHYGILNSVKDKLVFGENISQTNQFVATGAAQIGITAKSTVLSPNLIHNGHWQGLDPSSYESIKQGIVVLKQNKETAADALRFHDFIFSDKAQEILKKYGYSIDE
nr:molybdate ABC transporter substrate-binding protein [Allomuricauda sp.]